MADQEPRDLFYLWHLVETGILTPKDGDWEAPLWAAAKDAADTDDEKIVRVAIIDSGVDMGHPNLTPNLLQPQIDFQTRLNGAVYDPVTPLVEGIRNVLEPVDPESDKAASLVADAIEQLKQEADGIIPLAALEQLASDVANAADAAARKSAVEAFVGALPDPPKPAFPFPTTAEADALIDQLGLGAVANDVKAMAATIIGGVETIELQDPSRFFGAHGTASAGIIGGHPPEGDPDPDPFFSAMPYYGANPYCQLLSFATPYSHEIRPCIHALIAAFISGAEVILIPRGLPDMVQRNALQLTKSRMTRIDDPADATHIVPEDLAQNAKLVADGELFDALLAAISRYRYVVLAAGNDGIPGEVAYPANRQMQGTVEAQQAVVVGSINHNGRPSAYTNGSGPQIADKLLFMVSDDSFALDRDRASIDTRTRDGTDFDYTPHYPPGAENTFSPWAPLSLDVRGSYGYAASSNIDPPESDTGIDRGSLYTLFGGTSAASALAAGTIALLIQAGKLSADTPAKLSEIKQVMTDEGLSFDPQ